MTIAASPGSRKGSSGMSQAWSRFRNWRHTRPFWGSVISIIGGVEIYLAAAAPLSVVVMQGLPGLLTMAVFLVTVILAGVTLYQPHLRSITGLLILILGPLSIMATNLGGFVIGMLLLVVGGGLITAWAPAEDPLDLEYIAGESASEPSPAAKPARPAATTQVLGHEPTDTIDPIPSSSISTPVRLSDPDAELAAQKAALKASQVRPGQKKRPALAPRTGLPGVFDTMFGARRQPARKPGKRPAGKRPAGSRPAGPRPATSSSDSAGPSDPAGPSSAGPATASLSSLERPADPPTANARTWIIIPMLLVALGTPAVIAAPASASPVRPASDSPWDWLFPPATPTPSPSATPAPGTTPGLVLPTVPNLLPTPSPTPAATTGVAAAASCPSAKSLPGTTSGGQKAIDGAVAMQACVSAAEAAPGGATVKADATGTTPTVSNDLSVLKASRMEMSGFKYAGVATVDSPNGPVKVLHFSASSIKVEGMNQTYPFKGGTTGLKNNGTATLQGNVELYVTDFKSNVFGLIPLEFSVDGLQPPLVLDSMFFTDATSVVALVQCDQILLGDLSLKVT